MDPQTHLEYALFQLTPTRTRCDLLIFCGNNKEKLASGLVEPFISHLKFFKDQISKGGYSVTLRPPNTSTFWFTKSTFQRVVRFINSPEVLERFTRIEREILQIENSVQSNELSFTNVEEHAGEGGLSSSDGSTKKSADSSKIKTGEGGGNAKEENSKIQLQRLLETRKAMLRKEQAMAYARALVAGFEMDTMNDLILFADNFGASRLREACMEFMELCKQKHNDGLWMDELAAMAAYPPSELAYSGTSGLVLATDASSDLHPNQEVNKDNDQIPSTPPQVPMQMQWPNQIPQYMYNYAGPQGQRYSYPYPGMPPFYPGHMSWPPNADDSNHGRRHRSSSKKKSKSKSSLPESSEEEDDDNGENGDSDSMSDSDDGSKHEKSTFSNGKKNRKKSSKTVVIRNINYITSNRNEISDDGEDESSVENDSIKHKVDGVLESLAKHHNKSSKSHDKKKKNAKFDSEVDSSVNGNENWGAFQNLLLKDDVEDEHFTIRNSKDESSSSTLDLGNENIVKKQQNPTPTDSFVVPERDGVSEYKKVNFQDFENGETFRPSAKRGDSMDADMMISQRFEEDVMRNSSDLQSETSRIRNGRQEDWFMVNNLESTITKSTTFDDEIMKGGAFSSETNKKIVPIDDSFMVQPQSTMESQQDLQWRSTDVTMVEDMNKTDPIEVNIGQKGFYEPDDLYLMVSRESAIDSSVRSSWTPEIDYGTEIPFTKSEPKSAPEEMNGQTEEKVPVKSQTKKAANNLGKDGRSRILSRSLPTNKKLPLVSRPVVHKSKKEQEDEIRKKMEELAIQRQKRIAERTAASGGSTPKLRLKPAAKNNGSSAPLKKINSKVTSV